MIGVRPTAKYKRRMDNRCFRGHAMTPDNLYAGTLCRACRRERDQTRRTRRLLLLIAFGASSLGAGANLP